MLRLLGKYHNGIRHVVDWLRKGFENGFALGLEMWAVPSELGYGIARFREQDDEGEMAKIREGVEEECTVHNRVLKIATDPDPIPLAHFCESPTFHRDKMELGRKTRKIMRITNSKKPSDTSGVSVNDMMSAGWSTVERIRFRDAKQLLRVAGPGAIFIKEDICDAYRLLAVRLLDLAFIVFRCGRDHFLDTRLTFGLRTAPRIFSVFADTILCILHNEGVASSLHYLDDFIVVLPLSDCLEKAEATRDLIRTVFKVLGIQLSLNKEQFGQHGDIFGFLINTVDQTIRLPPIKAEIDRQILEQALSPGKMSLHEFDQLCGKLVGLLEIIPQAGPMIQQAWQLKREMYNEPGETPIRVSPRLARDLRWLLSLLSIAVNGRCYALRPWLGDVLQGTNPKSDASLTGMGGHCDGEMWQHPFTEDEKGVIASSKDIHIAEALAVLRTTWVFRHRWRGKRVNFECDNQGVVAAINFGECRSDITHLIIRHIANIAIQFDFHFGITRILRDKNMLSDQLSKCFPVKQVAPLSSECRNNLMLLRQVKDASRPLRESGVPFSVDAAQHVSSSSSLGMNSKPVFGFSRCFLLSC
jgi:hypothetical protein